jgi:hypothetical protein
LPPAKKTIQTSTTKMTSTRRGAKQLSPQHKAAMAAGRTEAADVRAYLDALETNKPRRGRQRTAATIERHST